MGCLTEGCSEDPYCHDCPSTDPLSITLTMGDLFPSKLGDANIDGTLSILDIVFGSKGAHTRNPVELRESPSQYTSSVGC